ncbi:hypothetical protein CK203_086383 [Vitis vinifera]|uniref:Uncharacterized protein n=1 Tax=Vitis vinifera TaxID=29760 RepID=A0A438ERI8_VITVI|nr:hypothetical protein CK203_086383 [Vitis vinifera]
MVSNRNPTMLSIGGQISDESSQDTGEFNKEEIEKLRSLLGTLAKPLGACSLALAGATNHMTNSSLKFSIYSLCPSNIKITTADGSLTTVVDQGLGEDDVTC